MRAKKGMPPSHNCVWVESEISPEELTENWETAFGKTNQKTNGEWQCTCNWKEVSVNDKIVMTRDSCKIHGKAERMIAKVTDAPKKHSRSHMKKVRDIIHYGKGDMRELL